MGSASVFNMEESEYVPRTTLQRIKAGAKNLLLERWLSIFNTILIIALFIQVFETFYCNRNLVEHICKLSMAAALSS